MEHSTARISSAAQGLNSNPSNLNPKKVGEQTSFFISSRKLWLGSLFLGLSGIMIMIRFFARSQIRNIPQPLEQPSEDYESALLRFAQLQAQDDEEINPVCGSQLLTHGQRTKHVIILMHGITNCPQQFVELAPLFYERGYNVLIPRMPRNGLKDRMTDELKYLTAQELCDASNLAVDIARGLGEEITFLGLSAGGTLAAWVAQHRADVAHVILIAPMFGLLSFGPRVTLFLMWLFLRLPNIGTQYISPFQDGPTHSYLGYSSHALAEVMQLAHSVYRSAKTQRAAVRSVLVITNEIDKAVNNEITMQLIEQWRRHGLESIHLYTFSAEQHLLHDMIDPQQVGQQTSLVYPILLELATHLS
ncbi:alpha/beta hydrolase [Tengunoibacter tsumagoiensis]|uniref:AB hydrolase-1 domain-containing protein n=1 Tax=Tengunoibacter tsumagoiensis TaxID=2014871 RepID=A0A402A4B8_9CHLR|nr:alpha/beta fold hydrolase [Tengunoibacter tsumagoiensis]GCE13896.1 hypothetical protein KTT_37550 [Tengunoibacter tsumagoiensis]